MNQKKSKDELLQAAREYVNKQIATMKEHGSAPKLSAKDLNEIANEVKEAVAQ